MDLVIRRGEIADLEYLDWAWGQNPRVQAEYVAKIERHEQEFWVVIDGARRVGEIHVVWADADPDRADGDCRAYLSTYRIHPDYRNRGLGVELINRAVRAVRERGCTEVTIGVYLEETEIQDLYRRWGFTETLKTCPDTTAPGRPEFILFLRRLAD